MKLVHRFCRFLDAAAAYMEAKPWVCLILAAWVFFVATGMRAGHRAFWYDELLTVYLCALPRFADVMGALRAGIDLNPPGQYVAVRAAQAVFGAGPMATRFPALLGFLLMSLCLFLYLRRRAPAPLAFAGMICPWLTGAYQYAMEARPYGIVLGCAGLALLSWSRAAEMKHRRGLTLAGISVSLAAALSAHCYAVLLAIPLVCGEAVRLWRRRRPDWPMWGAVALSALPLVWYPMLLGVKLPPVRDASVFHVSPATLAESYGELLQPIVWPLLFGLVIVSVTRNGGGQSELPERHRVPGHELAALWGFAAIPVFAVALAALSTGSYSMRYGVPGVIGVASLLAWCATANVRNGARAGAALALLFLGVFVGEFGVQLYAAMDGSAAVQAAGPPASAASGITAPGNPLLSSVGADLPVVIGSGLTFLVVDHYANDAALARTYYITDMKASLRHTGSAWFDFSYPVMKRLLHLRANVEPADQFLARNRRFLVYSNGEFLEWALPELLERHWRVQLLARNGATVVAEVTAP